MLDLMLKRDELAQKANVLLQLIEKNKAEFLVYEKLKDDLNEDLENKEILFKLAPNILMSNKNYFLVNVGGGVFLEKNKEDLKAYLEKKAEKTKQIIEKLNKELTQINEELARIDEQLAKVLPQQNMLY